MQHAPSRFLKAAAVSRFLVRHPQLSRFIAEHVPHASRYLDLPAVATVPHVAPKFTARARPKPPPFTFS